jgi:hypothetical protein
MSEYIEREALMEELAAIQSATYMSTCLTEDECKGKRWMIARAIDAVKAAPAADVAQVVHGRWIYKGASVDGKRVYECSACHNDIYATGTYCKECGAKMDKEDET